MSEGADGADEDWRYAPVTTLEGLLQRGRGLGAILAADDPQAPGLVYACIRRDCRWDTLVDERHHYLARLVRDLELPLAPVTALLEGGPVEHESASEVLRLHALAGSGEAREALRAYIRDGERWMSVLESVAGSWPVADWDDLLEPVRARLVGEEPELLGQEPWLRWRDQLGLIAPPTVGRKPDALAGLDTGPLLALIADPGTSEGDRSDALWSLARRSPRPSPGSLAPLLALVPSLGARDGREISGLRRAVTLLGATAVAGRTGLGRFGGAVAHRAGPGRACRARRAPGPAPAARRVPGPEVAPRVVRLQGPRTRPGQVRPGGGRGRAAAAPALAAQSAQLRTRLVHDGVGGDRPVRARPGVRAVAVGLRVPTSGCSPSPRRRTGRGSASDW